MDEMLENEVEAERMGVTFRYQQQLQQKLEEEEIRQTILPEVIEISAAFDAESWMDKYESDYREEIFPKQMETIRNEYERLQ